MRQRHRSRLTTLSAMGVIAILGVILGNFAANPHDQDPVAALIFTALVLLVPVLLALKGNRRDAIDAGGDRASHSDTGGPHDPV
jgi:uncharacterized membrane protein YfcA